MEPASFCARVLPSPGAEHETPGRGYGHGGDGGRNSAGEGHAEGYAVGGGLVRLLARGHGGSILLAQGEMAIEDWSGGYTVKPRLG
ncbi:hypothetical protein PG990_005726 [Apiospora arundinis]|uniref:Uncharacterized protein n=1 Tax=Apiospora arundinis TaxID=335852 RepID=A0ABR2J877_9PEZI